MNRHTLPYWIFTVLTALALFGGALGNLTSNPEMTSTFARLGYPSYMHAILGVWTLGAALTILVQRVERQHARRRVRDAAEGADQIDHRMSSLDACAYAALVEDDDR